MYNMSDLITTLQSLSDVTAAIAPVPPPPGSLHPPPQYPPQYPVYTEEQVGYV